MSVPSPESGLVIHYDYLWAYEAQRGLEYGRYARPCLIIAVMPQKDGPSTVLVAPITHCEPDPDTAAVELHAATRARLGLDGEPCWIILDEINAFDWPGPDLRQNKQGDFSYGMVPPAVLEAAKQGLLQSARAENLTKIPRSEVKA